MKLYKKVLLTLSGAGILAGCASDTSYQGVVIEKKEYKIFLDADKDGIVDYAFLGLHYGSTNRRMYEYIMPGDTVVWEPGNSFEGPYHPRNIKTVNGLTQDEISNLVRVRKSYYGKIR